MPFIEMSSVVAIGLYLAVRARHDPHPRRFAVRLAAVAFGAWLLDDLAIRAFGMHEYSAEWTWHIDRVPLVVVMAWPFLLHIAWDLSRHLLGSGHRAIALLGAFLAGLDFAASASVAAAARLWRFDEPGLFGVPPIALLAAALFTGATLWFWERNERRALGLGWEALSAPAAAVATVLALPVLWWGALRWISVDMHPLAVIPIVWIGAAVLSAYFLAERWRERVPTELMLARLPGVLVLGGIMLSIAASEPLVVIYALSIAMTYATLTSTRRVAKRLHADTVVRLQRIRAARTGAQPVRAHRDAA